MGIFDIFKASLNKAILNGYKPKFDWSLESGKIMDGKNYYSVIFDHDFLKAIWGETTYFLQTSPVHSHIGQDCVLWQWHAKQMLLEEEPLKYLEKNLHKDEWSKILK